MAVPHYVIDAPKGGGKIAIIPNPIVAENEDEIVLKNYEHNLFRYPKTTIKEVEVATECLIAS
jgi:lysine 2,3-aminomutase